MKQQGQVFELKTRSHGGEAVWAYRYRIAGRDSRRLQRRGSKTEQAAREALERVLGRPLREQGIDNPQRRYTEKRPFESWAELEALAAELGPHYGPLVLFAAATGLRPGEWIGLEHRDIDRDARVAYVRRAYRNGRVKCPKTEASVRAVPLQAIALAALERLPGNGRSPLVFPSPRGSYFDLH